VIFVSFYDFLLSILAPCTLVAICQPEFITRIYGYGWIWNINHGRY